MQEGKKIIASGGSAVGLSMFASFVGLCCIGPWTVALLGVSGAVSMARWQPFRPYILGVAGIMLAWAFWRTYRLKRVCLADGCADQRTGRATYISLWLSALLLVLAVFAEQLQWLLVDPTPTALRSQRDRNDLRVPPPLGPSLPIARQLIPFRNFDRSLTCSNPRFL